MKVKRALAVAVLLTVIAGCAGPDARREDPLSSGQAIGPEKLAKSLGIPWEKEYGTMAAVRVHGTIFVGAQLSWDDKGIIQGADVETQMRQAYANVAKLLEPYGAKLQDIVEETVFVTDMKAALSVAQKVRREVLGESATVASSIVEVSRLAAPTAQVAIKATAIPASTIHVGSPTRGRRGPRVLRGRGGRGGGFPFPY